MGVFNVAVNAALGGLTGGTAGAFTGAVAGAAQNRAQNQRDRAIAAQQEAINMYQNDPGLSSGNLGFNQASMNASPGFFAFLLKAVRFVVLCAILAVFLVNSRQWRTSSV